MKSSYILTLFSEEPPPRTAPSSFVFSILLHAVGFSLLLLGLRHVPRIDDRTVDRYTVRFLTPPKIEPRMRKSTASGAANSPDQSVAHDLSPGGAPASQHSLPDLTQVRNQTLVQPDAPPDLLIPQETPVPLALMWYPDNSPSQKIVPPPQQEVTSAETLPAMIKPNHEPNLADVNIAAVRLPSKNPVISAGTTTPIIVRGPDMKQVPVTSSALIDQPTPARVLSISPLQADQLVVIPLANQTSKGPPTDTIKPGPPDKTAGNGNGNPLSKQNGTGPGEGAGDQRGTGAAGLAVAQGGGSTGPDQGSNAGSGLGDQASVIHITLPKDGQFGIVVVGSAIAEKYPETVGIWGSRLVYTVYLHVGQGKSWILQYTMPRGDEASAAGNVTRPEAPWPYDITRPKLAPGDYTSEAIMVHGFVNLTGHFERLALVFPPGFQQAKFLLDALQRWQFRPARQNGQLAQVEVLLIIPEETE